MKEILSKLSSYNLFNYLLPGVIFVIAASKFSRYSFMQQDIIIGLILYYFIGLVISRFGSIAIEPFLRKISFIRCADYEDFVSASKKDEKLELLSEINNTYRTLCSLFALFLLLKVYEKIEDTFSDLQDWSAMILVILLFFMFLFSYRKQTAYVVKRIKTNG